MKLSLRIKIISLATLATLFSILVLSVNIVIQKARVDEEITEELDNLIKANAATVTQDMYNLCVATYDLLEMNGQTLDETNDSSVREAIMSTVVGNSGYVFVLGGEGDDKGHYIISKGGERDGENIWGAKDSDGKSFIQSIVNKATGLKNGDIDYEYYPWKNKGENVARTKVAAITYFEPWDWVIGAGTYLDDYYTTKERVGSAIGRMQFWTITLGTVIFIVVFIFAYYLGQKIAKPIVKITDTIQDIAQGEGDLTKRLPIESTDEVGDLANWFNTFVEKLHAIISQVRDSALQVTSASEEISASSEQLASGAEEQQSQTSEVATSIEEMAATILESSNNTNTASSSAKKAAEVASDGGSIVNQTIEGMDRINHAVENSAQRIQELGQQSEEIGKIIAVIDDIADQTNLLALNANIEAARAGDQGRGFAVVADEVRVLAERTTKATAEIAEMISGIQSSTNTAVGAMDSGQNEVKSGADLAAKAGIVLQEIIQVVGNVDAVMNQVAAATEQQSSAAEEISANVEGISTVTKESANSAQQMATAAQELSHETEALSALVGQFKL